MERAAPGRRAARAAAALCLTLSLCALHARAAALAAALADPRALAAPAVRQRGAPVVLDFDGPGFVTYEQCVPGTEGYGVAEDVFFECALGCGGPGGCPEECCFSRLGGGQLLYCQESGRCVRASEDTADGVTTVTLERYEIGALDGELVCPLAELAVGDGGTCAVRITAEGELECEDGVDVANTAELSSLSTCRIGDEQGSDRDADDADDAADVDDAQDIIAEVAECFPADASVRLRSGATKRMDELAAGDVVHVGGDDYSEVHMFSHKLPGGAHDFVRIATASGAVVRLTPGHLLPVNGALAPARSVSAGDAVRLADGRASAVRAVSRVSAPGLYNPHTLDGRIAVDGVACSAYTDAVHAGAAHAVLLAPCRAAWRLLGVECAGGLLHGDSRAGVALRAAWALLGRAAVVSSEL